MSEFLDKEWQNLVAIKSLLSSEGWSIFLEKVESLRDAATCEIENQESGFISQDGLSRLNYLLAKRNTLNQILLIKEELEDECENSPTQETVHNISDQVQER